MEACSCGFSELPGDEIALGETRLISGTVTHLGDGGRARRNARRQMA
jgi:hypothetical protein